MKYRIEEEEVIKVPVPQDTETYKAIPNARLIELVKEQTRLFGFEISDTVYRLGQNGNQMSAIYTLTTKDTDLSMMLGFYNSYNKTRRFAIGAGGIVNICYNGMISADFTSIRKHQGSIKDDLEYMIFQALKTVKPQFEELQEFKHTMQETIIPDVSVIHELIGEMFLTEDLLTTTQISALANKIQHPDETLFPLMEDGKLLKGASMWNFYNQVTEIYRDELPINFVDKHVGLHKYINDKAAILV